MTQTSTEDRALPIEPAYLGVDVALTYAVVMDGHGPREVLSAYALPGRYTRSQAIALVTQKNAELDALVHSIAPGRWHAEFTG